MGYAQPIAIIEPDGHISIEMEEATGLVRVTGQGLWSPTYIDQHFCRLDTALRGIRMAGLPVRVLVDLREAAVQQPETAARIQRATSELYHPADRIAIMVVSSLAKMQLRRTVQSTNHEFFLSQGAAEKWLHAWR